MGLWRTSLQEEERSQDRTSTGEQKKSYPEDGSPDWFAAQLGPGIADVWLGRHLSLRRTSAPNEACKDIIRRVGRTDKMG